MRMAASLFSHLGARCKWCSTPGGRGKAPARSPDAIRSSRLAGGPGERTVPPMDGGRRSGTADWEDAPHLRRADVT